MPRVQEIKTQKVNLNSIFLTQIEEVGIQATSIAFWQMPQDLLKLRSEPLP